MITLMGLTFVTEPVSVRTPATSANLGPGFDAAGLALTLYDDLTARVTGANYTATVRGEGEGELRTDEEHLVLRSMLATFDELGERPSGLAVDCVNRIPQARGLVSSSAAIVGGVQLARALVVNGMRLIDDEAALRIAARLEGHPDNVAPCLLGGFTIAWTEGAGARALRLPVSEGVRPTIFVPKERGYTASARASLPGDVPHA